VYPSTSPGAAGQRRTSESPLQLLQRSLVSSRFSPLSGAPKPRAASLRRACRSTRERRSARRRLPSHVRRVDRGAVRGRGAIIAPARRRRQRLARARPHGVTSYLIVGVCITGSNFVGTSDCGICFALQCLHVPHSAPTPCNPRATDMRCLSGQHCPSLLDKLLAALRLRGEICSAPRLTNWATLLIEQNRQQPPARLSDIVIACHADFAFGLDWPFA
jgi:hypothetical protein